ncbi:MAG: apolipoprotein N-acyltransferase [Desulfobacterales bacterium]|nr:apolipoprotein N-acyltransferase [Desulfobacterales bacterium]
MKNTEIQLDKIFFSVLSGLLLSASFPKIGFNWFAWIALVPLLISINEVSLRNSFCLGLLAGFTHYITLLYWLVYTMQVYGHIPLYLSVMILVLLCAYLSLYFGLFSAVLTWLSFKPIICFLIIPVLWTSLEYVRSFLFSGFPWGLIGYTQFNLLHLIQISDILGIYGISFIIALANATLYFGLLYLSGKDRPGKRISGGICLGTIVMFVLIFSLVWFYGSRRIQSIDKLASAASTQRINIVQGNIDQAKKWDIAFQSETIRKYIDLSQLSQADKPDLIVWPETAAPFYFLYDLELSQMVQEAVKDIGANFLIGSPSFTHRDKGKTVEFYNSAYLIDSKGQVKSKYDKVHLVPFGEYVPFHQWLPFLGKLVAEVGDFRSGKKGNVIQWGGDDLGIQICFEIIFPNLSRLMVENQAALLINMTNDAWFGKTSAPFQHFSIAIFRAVENRRALIRSANTGISGFIDPVGRIVASTPLFEEATMTQTVPLMKTTTFYTRFGDLFAMVCLTITMTALLIRFILFRKHSH